MENTDKFLEKLFNEEMMEPDMDGIMIIAKHLKAMYDSFITVGFNDNQAMTIILGFINIGGSVAKK